MAHPAAIGPHSQLPTASQLAHGAQECQPVGQHNTAQVEQEDQVESVGEDQVDSVEEDHSALAADLEDGVQHQVVPSPEATGATAHSHNQAPGRLAPGQSGGMETNALPLIGLVGPREPGRLLLHGLLGLPARLRSQHLLSTRPLHRGVTRHTRPPALVTRLLRLLRLASPPQRLRVPVALLQSRSLVVLRRQL